METKSFLLLFYEKLTKQLLDNFNIKYESSNGLGLPQESGIYFCIEIDKEKEITELVYIGSAKNIANRIYISKHDLTNYITKSKNFYKSFCFVYYLTNEYLVLEKQLIRFFNPKLNTYNKLKIKS